jgi:hypothetical protein
MQSIRATAPAATKYQYFSRKLGGAGGVGGFGIT